MNKKDKAFELFDEGKNPSSPEVKVLKLKGSTKYNYYSEWLKKRGDALPSSGTAGEAKAKSGGAKVKGKVISELEMLAEPMEEVNGEAVPVD